MAVVLTLPGCRGEPAELLPDLEQAPPQAVEVAKAGGRYRLVFLSAVDNVGLGPLVIQGRRPSRATPSMTITQMVQRSDGSRRAYATAGELRYVTAETHAHWHLLGFERYELRRASDRRLVAPDRKTGFCLGDRYETQAAVDLANEPADPVWTRECGRGQPGLLSVRQGISPGFGDDYVPTLEGQYVDITRVPAGRYLLVHRVNVDRTLRESNYSNNAASLLLELRWVEGEPSVRVLGGS